MNYDDNSGDFSGHEIKWVENDDDDKGSWRRGFWAGLVAAHGCFSFVPSGPKFSISINDFRMLMGLWEDLGRVGKVRKRVGKGRVYSLDVAGSNKCDKLVCYFKEGFNNSFQDEIFFAWKEGIEEGKGVEWGKKGEIYLKSKIKIEKMRANGA